MHETTDKPLKLALTVLMNSRTRSAPMRLSAMSVPVLSLCEIIASRAVNARLPVHRRHLLSLMLHINGPARLRVG
jgi:hypothetical protein